jgi:hypothetical protein
VLWHKRTFDIYTKKYTVYSGPFNNNLNVLSSQLSKIALSMVAETMCSKGILFFHQTRGKILSCF